MKLFKSVKLSARFLAVVLCFCLPHAMAATLTLDDAVQSTTSLPQDTTSESAQKISVAKQYVALGHLYERLGSLSDRDVSTTLSLFYLSAAKVLASVIDQNESITPKAQPLLSDALDEYLSTTPIYTETYRNLVDFAIHALSKYESAKLNTTKGWLYDERGCWETHYGNIIYAIAWLNRSIEFLNDAEETAYAMEVMADLAYLYAEIGDSSSVELTLMDMKKRFELSGPHSTDENRLIAADLAMIKGEVALSEGKFEVAYRIYSEEVMKSAPLLELPSDAYRLTTVYCVLICLEKDKGKIPGYVKQLGISWDLAVKPTEDEEPQDYGWPIFYVTAQKRFPKEKWPEKIQTKNEPLPDNLEGEPMWYLLLSRESSFHAGRASDVERLDVELQKRGIPESVLKHYSEMYKSGAL